MYIFKHNNIEFRVYSDYSRLSGSGTPMITITLHQVNKGKRQLGVFRFDAFKRKVNSIKTQIREGVLFESVNINEKTI